MKVLFRGYDVEVDVTYYMAGHEPVLHGHPDNWEEGQEAVVEFELEGDDSLLGELLMNDHFDELEENVIEAMAEEVVAMQEEKAERKQN